MQRLIEEFAKLPGIGRRTAERLAYHVLTTPAEEGIRLAEAVRDMVQKTGACSRCCNAAEGELCTICGDPRRDQGIIWVVEQPKDLMALENTGQVKGVYHVLRGRLAPLEGKEPDSLTLGKLMERVRAGGVKEVVLATNPDLEGDMTSQYVAEKLRPLGVRLSRLARGVPVGGSIEYASKATLSDAVAGRQEF